MGVAANSERGWPVAHQNTWDRGLPPLPIQLPDNASQEATMVAYTLEPQHHYLLARPGFGLVQPCPEHFLE